jgi:hypothetical protein
MYVGAGTQEGQFLQWDNINKKMVWNMGGVPVAPNIPGWRTGFFGTIGTRLAIMTGTGGGALLVDGYSGVAAGGGTGGGGSGSLAAGTYYDTWDRCLTASTTWAGVRIGRQWMGIGSAAGFGGFHVSFRWAIDIFASVTKRQMVGLFNQTTALGTGDPSANTNCVYVGCDDTQTTLRVMSNDNVGTATQAKDLGANFPSTSVRAACFEFHLWCLPNASTINWAIQRLDANFSDFGVISSDLPQNSVFLAPHCGIANSNATSVTHAFMQLIAETPN